MYQNSCFQTPVYEADEFRCFHCDCGSGGVERTAENSRKWHRVDKAAHRLVPTSYRRTKSVDYAFNPWPLKMSQRRSAARGPPASLLSADGRLGLRFRFLLAVPLLRQPQDVPRRAGFTTTTRTGCMKEACRARSSRTADSSGFSRAAMALMLIIHLWAAAYTWKRSRRARSTRYVKSVTDSCAAAPCV